MAEKKKTRFTIIEFPVLSHYCVHVEVASDIREAILKHKIIKHVVDESFPGKDQAVAVHVRDDCFSFMFFRPNPSVDEVTHECWHVILRIMEHLGAKLDNEIIAYHLGYLVGKTFKFARRK